MEQLSDLARREKLAREMTHRPQADIETLRGQDPLTDWALGLRERTLHPLEAMAKYSQEFQNMSPEEQGMQLLGGGMVGSIKKLAGKAVKKTQYEIAHELAQKNAALPIEKGGLGLPLNNTAMDRAKAMGFDTPAYHGTSKDFKEFLKGGGGGKTSGTGTFLTDNPNVASTYSHGVNDGNVIPVLVNKGKTVNIDSKGKNWNYLTKDLKITAPKIQAKDKEGDEIMRGLFGDSEESIINRPAINKTLGKQFPDTFRFEDSLSTDDIARWANSQGYDSTVFNAVRDRGPAGIFHTEEALLPSMNTVIFAPSNIRSRFAAFDPFQRNSANILAGVGAGAVALPLISDELNNVTSEQRLHGYQRGYD